MMKCPKCNSNHIGQYRMPTGAVWCNDCGFRAEHKEKYNPFLDSGGAPVEVKEFSSCVTTFFCISDAYNNQIRIPIENLQDFQVSLNKEIEKALITYGSGRKDE